LTYGLTPRAANRFWTAASTVIPTIIVPAVIPTVIIPAIIPTTATAATRSITSATHCKFVFCLKQQKKFYKIMSQQQINYFLIGEILSKSTDRELTDLNKLFLGWWVVHYFLEKFN
jgi:hypothetical protein